MRLEGAVNTLRQILEITFLGLTLLGIAILVVLIIGATINFIALNIREEIRERRERKEKLREELTNEEYKERCAGRSDRNGASE